ncbi:hypothetical protein K3495_g7900 [Podosphaera aphanis]|nr:hypothetical protein K3495_g7900 [Podosphaera aphanis]
MVYELSTNWKKIKATIKPSLEATSRRSEIKKLSEREKNSKAKRRRLNDKGANALLDRPDTLIEGNLAIPKAHGHTVSSEALAFWDIPSQDILEAYGGEHLNRANTIVADAVNGGFQDGVEIGKYVALDCEMVGVGGKGNESSVLARISIVNFHGLLIYDTFVKPMEVVTNWRTKVSGVSAADMETAREFKEVQKHVASIIKDKIVVGHALCNDFAALQLRHPKKYMRDTSTFSGFTKHTYGRSRTPALRNLARTILGLDIQGGEHSSIEDARVTMLIFKRHKAAIDAEYAKRHPESKAGSKSKTKVKAKKRKR